MGVANVQQLPVICERKQVLHYNDHTRQCYYYRGSTVLLCFCIITNMTKTVVCMLGQTQNCCYMLLDGEHTITRHDATEIFIHPTLLPCDVHSTVISPVPVACLGQTSFSKSGQLV